MGGSGAQSHDVVQVEALILCDVADLRSQHSIRLEGSRKLPYIANATHYAQSITRKISKEPLGCHIG